MLPLGLMSPLSKHLEAVQELHERDPRHGSRRVARDRSILKGAVRHAVGKACLTNRTRLTRRATSHEFRHSSATHLLEDGLDIRTVRELMGHHDPRTTVICTHVLRCGPNGVVKIPLGRL